MKCPDCGYEIEKPNQKTCPCCGASLKAIKTQPAEEVKQSEPFVQDSFRPEPPRLDTTPSAEPQHMCPRCQTPVPNGFNFCPSCGYDLREPSDTDSVNVGTLVASSASQIVNQDTQHDEPEPVVRELEPEIKPSPRRYEPQYTPYSSEPEFDEPEPEHYQPENIDYEEEEEDNPVMGGYYPYSGEEPVGDTVDEPYPPVSTSQSTSWLVIVIAAFFSLFIGALLYFVVN